MTSLSDHQKIDKWILANSYESLTYRMYHKLYRIFFGEDIKYLRLGILRVTHSLTTRRIMEMIGKTMQPDEDIPIGIIFETDNVKLVEMLNPTCLGKFTRTGYEYRYRMVIIHTNGYRNVDPEYDVLQKKITLEFFNTEVLKLKNELSRRQFVKGQIIFNDPIIEYHIGI